MPNVLNKEERIKNALLKLNNNSLLSRGREATRQVMNHQAIAGNQITPGQVAKFGVNAMPFVGDAIAIEDAKKEYQQGNYGWSAFNALTALPVIGDMATAAKMTIPAAASLGGLVGMMYRGAKSLPEATGKIARQRGIIGGVNAKTADLKALRQARIMENQGIPREQIWNETGWFKGVDDKWKFEIDDSVSATNQMILDGKVSNWSMGQLGIDAKETMAHPELYNAYPELGDIKTQGSMRGGLDDLISGLKGNAPSSKKGFYSPEGIGLSTSPENMRSTMLHELQHGAQDIEDFARGGSPEMFVRPPLDQARGKWAGIIKSELDGGGNIDDAVKSIKKEILDAPIDSSLYSSDDFAAALELYQSDDPTSLVSKWSADSQLPTDPFSQYKSLAGEAEARAVQTRMNMTPDERAAKPFWLDYDVPEQDQLVRFGLDDKFPQRSVVDDYGMTHRPAGREEGASLDNLSNIYPDDIYGAQAAQYYGHYGQNHPMDRESVRVIQSFKGRPNQSVTIYRAVPDSQTGLKAELKKVNASYNYYQKFGFFKVGDDYARQADDMFDADFQKGTITYDEKQQKMLSYLSDKSDDLAKQLEGKTPINPGDWVTINKAYAKEHGEAQLGGKYKIIQKKVKAKDIFTQGDSIHEWGYDPE